MKDFELPDGFFFFDGVEISNEDYVFAMLDKNKIQEQVDETYFIRKSRQGWTYLGEVPWRIATMCNGGANNIAVFSADGDVALVSPKGCSEYSLSEKYETPISIRSSKNRCGSVYVSGYSGVVLCLESSGKWIDVSPLGADGGWFESLSANCDAMCVVGLHGEVWLHRGVWNKVDYPSNANLHDICFCSSGEILVCGSDGHLGIGREDKWQIIEADILIDDLWRVFEYRGKAFISSMDALYEYRDGEVLPSDLMAKSHVDTFYNCRPSENGILIVGEESVSRCGLDTCEVVY